MFITKMSLPRRTFLRGMGATIALPFLDAMQPALQAAPAVPKRLGFIYGSPNGIIQKAFVPTTVGPGFDLSPILSPLAPVRDQLLVLSNLAHRQADSFGDGNGDHARGTAVWLSGVHAWDRRPIGTETVTLGTTIDQILAQHFAKDTQLPSLELVLEKPTQIACDSTDCFFSNTISWRSPSTPNPMEPHPRVVFERLFGEGGSAVQRLAQMRKTGSVIDSVIQEVAGLQRRLGASDRSKLGEYLTSVRELEKRIQSAEAKGAGSELALPNRPTDIPDEFEEHAKLMFDLQVLAYQADVTRVFSMLMAREGSPRSYPQIGVPEQHHPVSHHRDDPMLIAKKQKIDTYHIQLLGYFLEKLQATRDGDGSLLDHSLIVYGGGMGDGNLHEHSNLPTLVAGKLDGHLRTGQHLAYAENTPMANLFMSILDKVGIPLDKFGDSTGRLPIETLSGV
ncbi:MAG: DUF1552 domain-containing protein [Acidimicrobiia bacterium]|nr:DUF1552 domain-containing protein [Acidimicrobiia bacterium]